jgi:hypothetical protein
MAGKGEIVATTLNHGQTTIGTAATYVTTGVVGASYVYLHAPAGGNAIYVGGSAVTTSTGYELEKGQMFEIWLPEAAQLYAVVASNTEKLIWLHTGGR